MGCGSSSQRREVTTTTTTTGAGQRTPGTPAETTTAAAGGSSRLRPRTAPWDMETGPITSNQLNSRRQTFWESQSSGRAAVWSNLRVASEAMLNEDYELANTIVQAADLRTPHGDLSLCYDMLGNAYAIPLFAYSNPRNVVSEAEYTRLQRQNRRPHHGPVVDLPVVIRLSSCSTTTEQDVNMTIRSNTTAAELKQQIHEVLYSGRCDQARDATTPRPNIWVSRGLPPKRQRLMFRGRELVDDDHMQAAAVTAGSILQIFIRPEVSV